MQFHTLTNNIMTKKSSILRWSGVIALSSIFAISCQKEVSNEGSELLNDDMANRAVVDYSKYSGDKRAEACRVLTVDNNTDPRGAALTSKVWPRGQVITVSFIGGSDFVRERVIFYAKKWEEHANIKFNFISGNAGTLRVSFVEGAGSYSYVGTDALRIAQNQETMNFGWFTNNTPEQEFSRTTIHEFGHALGLIHEQQHPEANLDWDRDFVYEYYAGAPNFWNRQQVDINLLNRYSVAQTTFNDYDQYSIMHYAILGRLINQSTNTPNNTTLSEGDKELAGILYPF